MKKLFNQEYKAVGVLPDKNKNRQKAVYIFTGEGT